MPHSNEFLENAEQRTKGYLDRWLQNPAFRAALRKTPGRHKGAPGSAGEKDGPSQTTKTKIKP